jgi:retinol-binding protein 3
MMSRILSCAAALASVLAVTAASAQQQKEDFPIDAAYRTLIIDGVSQKLSTGYFDAARAALIKTQMSKRSVRASYDTCTTAASISNALTRDLQAWSHDRHLRVVFSVSPRPMPAPGSNSTASAPDADHASARTFGFHALTRLTGNIGYLELGRFEAAADAGATLHAAMQFLANTDALIIDLRYNGGGHADMVALVASYFLAEQTRLATLERRDQTMSDQIWSAAYVPGPRYLNRPVFILTSARTFSGAEGLTYDLKHFAHAVIVGEKTRGGANPGAFQQIDEHFAVFVPTARVVHAATGTNWDADGITPDVAVAAKDAKLAALKLALERLVADKPQDKRFGMWKEALDEMNVTPAK